MKATNLKKVLIALDFDPTAKKVAEVGYALGKSLKAEVVLLHVVSDPLHYNAYRQFTVMGFSGYDDTVPLILDGTKELKEESVKFLEKSKLHLADSTIQILVNEGDIAESIMATAKKIKADIIILGSHSQKWLENVLMGSVTEKILKISSIPIFIIPTKKRL